MEARKKAVVGVETRKWLAKPFSLLPAFVLKVGPLFSHHIHNILKTEILTDS